jgi:hypothetical protein
MIIPNPIFVPPPVTILPKPAAAERFSNPRREF